MVPGFSTMGSLSLYRSITKIPDDILSKVHSHRQNIVSYIRNTAIQPSCRRTMTVDRLAQQNS